MKCARLGLEKILEYLSYIYRYLRSVLYLSFVSPVRRCGTLLYDVLFYRQGNDNQTDQGDETSETEGLGREGLEIDGFGD